MKLKGNMKVPAVPYQLCVKGAKMSEGLDLQ